MGVEIADDWPLPDGAELLNAVEQFVARFVAFPSEAARVAVVMWTAHAHLVDASDNSPRLALLSPEPGSGKTRTLEVLELLVLRPMAVLNASAPAIFRSIESERPTLLFDEVDAVFGRHGKEDPSEDLRGLLNAGHRRSARIPRCVGPKHDVMMFPVFAAVALAGLGDLPDTLMSRSVIVRMRRRAPDERVEPFRHRVHAPQGEQIRERLVAWAKSVSDDVREAWPDMPDGVEDRPADVWEPLLAVADAAGGDWPDRARTACKELVKVAENREASLGIKLLTDLREVFGTEDAMSSAMVVEKLCALEESPWSDLRGKPIDQRGLARRLRQYEVKPDVVRIGDSTPRGYTREDLYDVWTRYLPPDPQGAQQAQQEQQSRSEAPSSVADQSAVALANATPEPSATADKPLTSNVADVALVADSQGSEPVTCTHGMENGAEPDPFVNGRLRCPLCRAAQGRNAS